MKKYDLGWMAKREWIKYEDKQFVLREDAPQIAQESYKRYLKQKEDDRQRLMSNQ